MTKKVSVIIPVFNDQANLQKCLSLIIDKNVPDMEVIVIDDASEQNLEAIVKEFPCKYFRLPINKGPAYCRNFGAHHSAGEILLFTDSDCFVMIDWVAKFVEVLENAHNQSKDVVAICGRLASESGLIPMSHVYTGYAYVLNGPRRDMDYLNTSCAGIYRDSFLKVGGFDENLRNSEDPDLAMRLTQSGQRVLFEPSIFIFHNHGIKTFMPMIQKHKKWGYTLGLSLMQKHPQCFPRLLPLLQKPLVHLLLIVPLAMATSFKIVKFNFRYDGKVIVYFPLILINKIFFRWGIFLKALQK